VISARSHALPVAERKTAPWAAGRTCRRTQVEVAPTADHPEADAQHRNCKKELATKKDEERHGRLPERAIGEAPAGRAPLHRTTPSG
jgi:hypothetical protein